MKGKKIIGVLGLAVNQEGKFLLTLRNEPKSPDLHLKWNIPGGGHEFGETLEETLIREFKEELSVVPTIISPYSSSTSFVRKTKDFESQLILHAFLVTIGDQEIVLDEKENIDYRFVEIEEAKKLATLPKTIEIMQVLQQLHIHKLKNAG